MLMGDAYLQLLHRLRNFANSRAVIHPSVRLQTRPGAAVRWWRCCATMVATKLPGLRLHRLDRRAERAVRKFGIQLSPSTRRRQAFGGLARGVSKASGMSGAAAANVAVRASSAAGERFHRSIDLSAGATCRPEGYSLASIAKHSPLRCSPSPQSFPPQAGEGSVWRWAWLWRVGEGAQAARVFEHRWPLLQQRVAERSRAAGIAGQGFDLETDIAAIGRSMCRASRSTTIFCLRSKRALPLRFINHQRKHAILQCVVAEDVGDAGGDDDADAVVQQGPRRVFA